MSAPLEILLARLANTLETARLYAHIDRDEAPHGKHMLATIEQAQRELEQVREGL